MIVLIDTKTKNILLYKETGLITIPFSEAADVYEYIGNQKVKYVTNAMSVGANDIVSLINSLGFSTISAAEMSNNKYIHGKLDGTIYVREGLQFDGKLDCKLIDKEMKDMLQSDVLMKKLISTGKVEIIGEVAKRKLDKEKKKLLAKNELNRQNVDARLDSIIMDGKVDDWDGSLNVNDHTDVMEIDLERGGRVETGGGASANTMSELMGQIDGQ